MIGGGSWGSYPKRCEDCSHEYKSHRVHCPKCDAVNYGTIQHMQVTIDCGKCSVPFTPSSLEKM